MKIIKILLVSLLLGSVVLLGGCQFEHHAYTKASVYRENENNGEVWKSRIAQGKYDVDSGEGVFFAIGADANKYKK